MLTKLLVTPLFIAASAVAHPAVKIRRGDVSLSDWSSSDLESFWSFKNRYSSLNCASQTGTDFYTNCCYPLGASESLSSRPAECTPASLTCSNTFSAASVPTPTPTPDTASSSSDSSSDDDYDESNLPYCTEGDDGYDDDDSDDTYSDASYNGGSSSSDTYTPPASSDNSQAQPTGSSGDNSGNTNSSGNTSSSSGSTSSSGSENTGGQATWYTQNGVAGACGTVNPDSAFIGAIPSAWWGDSGSRSQYCGKSVHITNLNTGQAIDIIVADECPSCASANCFDLSTGAFSALANMNDGVFPISWHFNN